MDWQGLRAPMSSTLDGDLLSYLDQAQDVRPADRPDKSPSINDRHLLAGRSP
jgi:hypothetical protein